VGVSESSAPAVLSSAGVASLVVRVVGVSCAP